MAANPNVRGIRLTIPNKDKPAQRNNLDTIERWANSQVVNQLVAGSGVTITNQPISSGTGNIGTGVVTITASGGGGYASLTGAGETVTPGALTQAGGFTVNDTAGDGFTVQSQGFITIIAQSADSVLVATTGGGGIGLDSDGGLDLTDTSSSPLTIQESGTGGISIVDAGSGTDAIVLPNLPTSSAGLQPGQLWNSGGVVHVV